MTDLAQFVLERELERFFRQNGIKPIEVRGDRYVGVGVVSKSSGLSQPEVYVGLEDRITRIVCIADLAKFITDEWGRT